MRKTPKERLRPRTEYSADVGSGDATRVLRRLRIRPGERIGLIIRVSTSKQRPHLADVERMLRRLVREKGGKVAFVYRHVGSGADLRWLEEAASLARRKGVRKLLAETPSRYARHADYDPKFNPDAQATDETWDEVARITTGLILMTACDPAATPGDEESCWRTRGQAATGNFGGRSRKKTEKRKRVREYPKPVRLAAVVKFDNGAPTPVSVVDSAGERWVVSRASLYRWWGSPSVS